MGQKVNPTGFRTGVKGCLSWPSRWFSRKNYSDFVLMDIKIREFINKNYKHTKISLIEIERSGDHLKVIINSAVPGLLIGKKGQDIENLRKTLSSNIKVENLEVTVQDVKESNLQAPVVAQIIAEQMERRVSFKKCIKRAALDVMKSGARGVKIRVSGRLDGVEIARDEWVRVGSVPLHTFRADIDFSGKEALTIYGKIGIKVWICRGEYRASV